MVLEVALIDVLPGQEDGFAAAYAKARPILPTTPGCRCVRMTRGIESPVAVRAAGRVGLGRGPPRQLPQHRAVRPVARPHRAVLRGSPGGRALHRRGGGVTADSGKTVIGLPQTTTLRTADGVAIDARHDPAASGGATSPSWWPTASPARGAARRCAASRPCCPAPPVLERALSGQRGHRPYVRNRQHVSGRTARIGPEIGGVVSFDFRGHGRSGGRQHGRRPRGARRRGGGRLGPRARLRAGGHPRLLDGRVGGGPARRALRRRGSRRWPR